MPTPCPTADAIAPRSRPPAGARALALALGVLLGLGCVEGTDGPVITGARPDPAVPGQALRIDGVGFGEAGHVAIGGRPLIERYRGPESIEVELPADLPGGPSWLVVVAGGRPSPEFPITVAGDNRPATPGPRVFPPGTVPDGGVRDRGPSLDRGLDPDDGLRVDMDPAGPLVAEFDPDPGGAGTVRLAAVEAPAGRLILEVVLPEIPIRGLALHLAYDRGLLRYVGSTPGGDRRLAVSEIGPGRLALGRILAGGDPRLRLEFALVGPGEGRVDLPAKNRTARDGANRPITAVDFAGGGVRVRRR